MRKGLISAMDKFIRELQIGEIHARDRLQFELKSEYFPPLLSKSNTYEQEFYIFIPNPLNINKDTYSSQQFYEDQTNFIRYKTPVQSFKQILDPFFIDSPLYRIKKLYDSPQDEKNQETIEDELKLLGNIVRSLLRRVVTRIIKERTGIETLCQEIDLLYEKYEKLQKKFHSKWKGSLDSPFSYTKEFIDRQIHYYLTGLLRRLRNSKKGLSKKEDDLITHALLRVIQQKKSKDKEHILYRSGLLNKYVLDALLLKTTRASLYEAYRNIIGSVSAGIAMLFFFVLFIWGGEMLIINSTPFILMTVFLYIMKDRIKEGLRVLSYRHFHKWFSDYRTDILSPNLKEKLGEIAESFSFVNGRKLPEVIVQMRNRDFHDVLDQVKRPERIIYYKKKIRIKQRDGKIGRRYGLNSIFRFNLHQFLKKAANPIHDYLTMDVETHELKTMKLPKVYHLNIIIKNSWKDKEGTPQTEYKMYRIILNKEGIVRVEKIS